MPRQSSVDLTTEFTLSRADPFPELDLTETIIPPVVSPSDILTFVGLIHDVSSPSNVSLYLFIGSSPSPTPKAVGLKADHFFRAKYQFVILAIH
jgi:hypothetical protein